MSTLTFTLVSAGIFLVTLVMAVLNMFGGMKNDSSFEGFRGMAIRHVLLAGITSISGLCTVAGIVVMVIHAAK